MTRIPVPRHVRDVLRALPDGWAWSGHTMRGHHRLTHEPSGAILHVAGSPSCPRAVANCVSDARRAVAAAQARRRP